MPLFGRKRQQRITVQCKRDTARGTQCRRRVSVIPHTTHHQYPDCGRHEQLSPGPAPILGPMDHYYSWDEHYEIFDTLIAEREAEIKDTSILDAYYERFGGRYDYPEDPYADYVDGTFRKIPVEISAYQVDRDCVILNAAGDLHAKTGDWIITGIEGEQYPCDDEIFRETYDYVDGDRFSKKPVQMDAQRAKERQTVMTLEGPTTAERGDWIITGVRGERWPVKHETFRADV